jgi:uncharacterized DUF497 family protein
MEIKTFIWDRFNIEKCQKHGLEISLIEDFLLIEPFTFWDQDYSSRETRFIAFGRFRGRLMFVVFVLRVADRRLKFRVLSARYAREKEMQRLAQYEKNKKQSAPQKNED